MNRGGRRPNRGNSNRRTVRTIGNTIRAMHLNQAATWHLNKTRNFDPPPYVEDVIYQRKVRLSAITTGTTSIAYTPASILAAAGLVPGSFTLMTVLRADFYGQAAAASNGLSVISFIISSDGQIARDRDFEDNGVQGSRRPHISISISPKDQGFVETSGTSQIFNGAVLDGNGGTVSGQIIADFMVQFKNTAAAVREARLLATKALVTKLSPDGSNSIVIPSEVSVSELTGSLHAASIDDRAGVAGASCYVPALYSQSMRGKVKTVSFEGLGSDPT